MALVPSTSRGSSGGGISSGTSNPAGPAAGDLFFRSDLGLLIYYDGTRWLTVTQYQAPFAPQVGITGGLAGAQMATSYDLDMWIEKVTATLYVIAPNDASNYWTLTFIKSNPTAGTSTLGSYTTQSDAPATRLRKSIAVGAALGGGASWPLIYLLSSKTAAPGAIDHNNILVYRLIVP